ncbi:MAG: MBL fold metallo-hydrolase [Clostridiales bacterium]|nr:MBL fold metallo-hydrolase [Clostridiales bacterium]
MSLLTFRPIASSSAGNAYLVTDGHSRLLLEAGISFRRLQRALDYTAPGLDGCLITHEHKDHAGHIRPLLECGVPVYASPGTARALEPEEVCPFQLLQGRNVGPAFQIGSFTVVPFRTFHDAAEPVGYLIRGFDGEQLVFATDTVGLNYEFREVAIYALEANYDDETLSRNRRMPEARKKRVRNSHMEIHRLCSYLEGLDLTGCRELWLLHLSDVSGNENYFTDLAQRAAGPGVAVRCAEKG